MYENEEVTAPQNFCTRCGTPIKAGARFCAACGKPIAQSAPQQPAANVPPMQQNPNMYAQNGAPAQQYQNGYAQGAPAQQTPNVYPNGNIPVDLDPIETKINRRVFIEQYADPSIKLRITICAIICYLCFAANTAFWVVVNPLGLIAGFLLLGFAMGMHLGKSWVCAILILIHSCIEMAVSMFLFGIPFGWTWFVAGVFAVINFYKANTQYHAFLGR